MINCTLVLCTNNLTPEPLLWQSLNFAAWEAEKIGAHFVIISHCPVTKRPAVFPHGWDGKRIKPHEEDLIQFIVEGELLSKKAFRIEICDAVIGIQSSNRENFCKQIVQALTFVPTEYVIFVEDDVIYPKDYFKNIAAALEESGADLAIHKSYSFLDSCGFYDLNGIFSLSRYAGKTDLFLQHFQDRAQKESKHVSFEPQLKGLFEVPGGRAENEEVYDSFVALDGHPVLDIKHGLNFAGTMMGSAYTDEHPFWGRRRFYNIFLADQKVTAFLREHQEYVVGLDQVSRKGKNVSPEAIGQMVWRAFQ